MNAPLHLLQQGTGGEVQLMRWGGQLARLLRVGDVVALSGNLGAGKTTLARAILEALGLEEEAPSPTFALVQPYDAPPLALPVWHVDAYRLAAPSEARELGLEDAFETALCLIEWPEKLGAALPPDVLWVRLDGSGDARTLTLKGNAAWQRRLAGLEPLG